eukprot:8415658-Prorocentrum_lima.AAC.1
MIALVNHAKKRVVPYARTRFNIIPDENQEVATPISRLLGAYTIRGCGVTTATLENETFEGTHALARLDDEMN